MTNFATDFTLSTHQFYEKNRFAVSLTAVHHPAASATFCRFGGVGTGIPGFRSIAASLPNPIGAIVSVWATQTTKARLSITIVSKESLCLSISIFLPVESTTCSKLLAALPWLTSSIRTKRRTNGPARPDAATRAEENINCRMNTPIGISADLPNCSISRRATASKWTKD